MDGCQGNVNIYKNLRSHNTRSLTYVDISSLLDYATLTVHYGLE